MSAAPAILLPYCKADLGAVLSAMQNGAGLQHSSPCPKLTSAICIALSFFIFLKFLCFSCPLFALNFLYCILFLHFFLCFALFSLLFCVSFYSFLS